MRVSEETLNLLSDTQQEQFKKFIEYDPGTAIRYLSYSFKINNGKCPYCSSKNIRQKGVYVSKNGQEQNLEVYLYRRKKKQPSLFFGERHCLDCLSKFG